MRKVTFFLGLVFLLGTISFSFAETPTTQVDSLIKKLVDKGILTKDEGDQLKSEVAYDEKTLHEESVKKDLPQWAQDLKLSGDMRIRYDHAKTDFDTSNGNYIDRGRLRLRLGINTKVNDKVNVGIGIASDGGSGNARSSNESFSASAPFGKVAPVLNYAYAEYNPNDRLKLTAGKMKNPIWEPFEFLWDADITPEGGAIQFNYRLSDASKLFFTGTAFQLADISTNEADPFMYVVQAGSEGAIGKLNYKAAGMFNGTDNITKTLLGGRPSGIYSATNTTANSQYVYHYNTAIVGLEVGLSDPFGDSFPIHIPKVGVFGSYADNPGASQQNTAWMTGVYIGNSKVNSFGDWKITSMYRYIGADAWLDSFPDSDFYGGSTDVKGFKDILEVGLAKNVSAQINYYSTDRIKAISAPEHRLQTDINFRF